MRASRSRSRTTRPSTTPAGLSEVLTAASAVSPAAVALGPFLAVTGQGVCVPARTPELTAPASRLRWEWGPDPSVERPPPRGL